MRNAIVEQRSNFSTNRPARPGQYRMDGTYRRANQSDSTRAVVFCC